MGKAFLSLLGAIAASVLSIVVDAPVLLIVAGCLYLLTIVLFIIAILNFIKSTVNTHRQVRQAIDDERIQKMYDKFNKG